MNANTESEPADSACAAPVGPATEDGQPASAGGDADSADLVRRAQRGELAAFNMLVLRHQHAAYSLVLRFLGTSEAAEDATQEAFIRAYRAIGSFRGEHFRSWLFSIVANVARDEQRRQRRRPQRSLDENRDDPDRPSIDPPDPGPSPEAEAQRGDLRSALDDAIEAGGDFVRVNNISFTVDEPEPYLADASEQAMTDARDHAEELATLAGVKLGKARSISESGGAAPLTARGPSSPWLRPTRASAGRRRSTPGRPKSR